MKDMICIHKKLNKCDVKHCDGAIPYLDNGKFDKEKIIYLGKCASRDLYLIDSAYNAEECKRIYIERKLMELVKIGDDE